MGLKITLARKLPSVVLLFSDSESPEDYESGDPLEHKARQRLPEKRISSART